MRGSKRELLPQVREDWEAFSMMEMMEMRTALFERIEKLNNATDPENLEKTEAIWMLRDAAEVALEKVEKEIYEKEYLDAEDLEVYEPEQ